MPRQAHMTADPSPPLDLAHAKGQEAARRSVESVSGPPRRLEGVTP